MYCRNCGNYFYVKRKLLELFKSKKELLCDECYNKYPINIDINHLLLDKYHCIIISLFKQKYNLNFNCYIKEYSKILITNMYRKDYHLIFLDYVDLQNDYTLEVFDIFSKLHMKNLIVFCFFVRK